MRQLTLEGQEIDHPPRRTHLGPRQRDVLRFLAIWGSITSTQAGRLHHSAGCPATANPAYRGSGCCNLASSVGSRTMRRLAARGIVVGRGGLWYAADKWVGS